MQVFIIQPFLIWYLPRNRKLFEHLTIYLIGKKNNPSEPDQQINVTLPLKALNIGFIQPIF